MVNEAALQELVDNVVRRSHSESDRLIRSEDEDEEVKHDNGAVLDSSSLQIEQVKLLTPPKRREVQKLMQFEINNENGELIVRDNVGSDGQNGLLDPLREDNQGENDSISLSEDEIIDDLLNVPEVDGQINIKSILRMLNFPAPNKKPDFGRP